MRRIRSCVTTNPRFIRMVAVPTGTGAIKLSTSGSVEIGVVPRSLTTERKMPKRQQQEAHRLIGGAALFNHEDLLADEGTLLRRWGERTGK